MHLKLPAAILLLFALWWFCYPEPTRTIPEQPTEIERMEIRAWQKKHGNYMIVVEPGRTYMVTPKGRVRL